MVNLDKYIKEYKFEEFKTKILTGITDKPTHCVKIMERAFGKNYSVSPILGSQISTAYERAINELLERKKIVAAGSKFKNTQGQVTVFTTSYKLINTRPSKP